MNGIKIILILFSAFNSEKWEKTFDTGLNLSQSYYNSSWQGGDVGTVTWLYYINSDIKGPIKNNINLINNLKIAFGQSYLQDNVTKKWGSPQKSTDKIDDEITLFYNGNLFIKPYLSTRFLSQFYDNSYPSVPLYINPVDLSHSIGVLKSFFDKESENLILRFGIASKENIKRVVDTLENKVKETKITTYGGFEMLMALKYKLKENIFYEGKLRIFKAFINSEASALKGLPEENYWKEPDVEFENTLSISLSKYIQISIYIQLLYDKEQTKGVQVKENMALGIVYKVFD